jgi:hypothetical protein
MTIGGWTLFGIFAFIIGVFGLGMTEDFRKTSSKVTVVAITVVLILTLLCGMLWYFNNTAAGQRQLIDQKSNLSNGLYRTVTVYTANGDVIAEYTGMIDIETNDGRYIKCDFEGKRYIYYNCFVESIAVIE